MVYKVDLVVEEDNLVDYSWVVQLDQGNNSLGGWVGYLGQEEKR
jgi:hypothetical protein